MAGIVSSFSRIDKSAASALCLRYEDDFAEWSAILGDEWVSQDRFNDRRLWIFQRIGGVGGVDAV